MASLDNSNEISEDNLLTFISHLLLSGYTTHYITGLVYGLMYHINAEGVWADVWQSPIIQQALEKVGPRTRTEDMHIPLTPGIIEVIIWQGL